MLARPALVARKSGVRMRVKTFDGGEAYLAKRVCACELADHHKLMAERGDLGIVPWPCRGASLRHRLVYHRRLINHHHAFYKRSANILGA